MVLPSCCYGVAVFNKIPHEKPATRRSPARAEKIDLWFIG
jgi:hypothetical protein